jgi:hypothetical protein
MLQKAPERTRERGRIPLNFGDGWNQGISIEMGQAPVKRCNEYLRHLVVNGLAKPSSIVSHRLPLEAAPVVYDKFDRRVDGYTKVVLKPALAAWRSPNQAIGSWPMANAAQRQAAKKNIKKAQSAAQQKRSIASMPKATRTALGKQGAAVAQRKRTGATTPKTRAELYEEAKRRNLPGRSKMGRAELASALGQG